uniref:Polypeptide N-acetylgalactosaminyltransferase n=1 Tax=Panagrellus redivivus TaxID=6233 RepID=A0A7E4ZWW5_PANRE
MRKKWTSVIAVFGFIWLVLVFINIRSINDPVVNVNIKEETIKVEDFGKVKFNGAEADQDADSNRVDSRLAKVVDEDRASEHLEPQVSAEKIVSNQSFVVNPMVQKLVDDEERWGYDKVPEVNLTELSVMSGPEDIVEQQLGYKKYEFNALLSDRIGPRRKIPDSRHQLCTEQTYADVLPSASIIICYFNELPSVLIRMVNSIIDRTPKELVTEILLVDDQSDADKDAEPEVQNYAAEHWPSSKIRFLRTENNEGLIRAKMFGAKNSVGEVLVFLDSHCEVNENWLPPLLDRIRESPSKVVCPIIDIINSDTFQYVTSPVCTGGFNWALTFIWDYPPRSFFNDPVNYIKPLKSATMAGGLFAINRNFFYEIGQYDNGMDVWGAENVEISFRLWMCGGELEIIPCSRVGHIFRRRRPYGTGVDSMGKNSLRTALVWMDEYKEKFYEQRPYLRMKKDYGDISEMVSLREKLQCKSFQWYLENIYPKMLPGNSPTPDVVTQTTKVLSKFLIRLNGTTLCLTGETTSGRIVKGARVFLEPCRQGRREQTWRFTEKKELRPMGSSMLCLDSLKGLRLFKCHMQGAHQTWLTSSGKFFNAASGKCLTGRDEIASLAETEFCAISPQWVLDPIVTPQRT